MFDKKNINKKEISILLDALKKNNADCKNYEMSKEYHLGKFVLDILKGFKSFKQAKRNIKNIGEKIRWQYEIRKYPIKMKDKIIISDQQNEYKPNYFSKKEFVVYTAIFGGYDIPQEPLFVPDNCRFIFIGDVELSENSIWKKYDVSLLPKEWHKLDNASKNRYCKMFPHQLFPEVEVSIYIDGNIKPICDLTEYINIESVNGITLHKHLSRQCAYQEIDACVIAKKLDKNSAIKYKEKLRNEKFPTNYGLAECNFIVRDHTCEIMKKIMEEWWEQYKKYIKRDQISFPYVLWKNNIPMETITKLGDNVYRNASIRIERHNN